MTKFASIFERGYEAIEHEDLAALDAALAALVDGGVDEADVRVRYLEFMRTVLDEEAEAEVDVDDLLAAGVDLLEDAVELDDPELATAIVVHVVELIADFGEIDEVELALRKLLEREDLSAEADGEARLIQAQVLLEYQEDPDEALAVLDDADPSFHEDSGYVTLRAAVLLDLDREDEAIELLRAAIAREDDTELRYQLGMVLREAGEDQASVEELLIVRERDLVERELDPDRPLPDEESADLRRQLEDVLDTLPEPVLERVAAAAIRVERWPTVAAVREGCDPRAPLVFEGEAASDDDPGRIDALVIYRDALVAVLELDEDIPDMLAFALVEEVARFLDTELFTGMP